MKVTKQYLCGNSFTTADISVLPRVLMYPMIGFLKTDKECGRYPNLIRYMNRMATRKSILASDRSGKKKSWISYPWPLIDWIGNWRSGKSHRHVYSKGPVRNQQPALTKQSPKENVVIPPCYLAGFNHGSYCLPRTWY